MIWIITIITTALELFGVRWLNKKEELLKLNFKRSAVLIIIGNLLLAGFAFYQESQTGAYAVWQFGLWNYLFLLAIYDIKFKELPDCFHLLPILFYGVAWLLEFQQITWQESLITAFVMAAVLGLIYLVRKDAIGLGDIKLLVLCGAYCGTVCIGIVMRGLVGAFVCGLGLLLFKKATAKSELPFVPFLFLGALLM